MATTVVPLPVSRVASALAARPARPSRPAPRLVASRRRAAAPLAPRVRLVRTRGSASDASSSGASTSTADAAASSPPAPSATPPPRARFDLLGLMDSASPDAVERASGVFERVDAVVMGGVSSSTIRPDLAGRRCLVWSGKCRVEGGGFTGARSVALRRPLDLSPYDGLMIACAFESDDEPERRTWKATVRTQNDRGEVVYQASFVPPVSSGVSEEASCVCIPWSEFRLVRGPVVVPGVPPLSKDRCDSVYGLGLIMSRFGPRGPMPDFREGPFRLALRGLGVFSDSPSDASPPALDLVAAVAENAGKKSSENRGTRNVVTWILAPLIKVAFSESRRRRRRARALLKERFGVGALRARFGFGQRLKKTRFGGDGVKAAAEGVRELAGDAVAAALTLPLRAVFVVLGKIARLVRAVKGEKQLPKMR